VFWPPFEVIIDVTTKTLVLLELVDCAAWLDVELMVDDVIEDSVVELVGDAVDEVVVGESKVIDLSVGVFEDVLGEEVVVGEVVVLDEDVVVEELVVLDEDADVEELAALLFEPAIIGKAASENLLVEVSQQPGFGGFWSLSSGRFASQQ